MTEGSARIKFSLADGLMEIEGSEAFVADQLSKLEPLVTRILQSGAFSTGKGASHGDKKNGAVPQSSDGLDEYQNIFALADGKVQILKDLPGSSKAQKAVSAALLLAYANHLQGVSSVKYETIRDTCSAHACLDSTNFSKNLKAEKAYFIISGNSGSQSIALTVPGKKKAAELAASLNA